MEYINEKLVEFENSLVNKKIAIIGMGVSNIPLLDYFSNKEAFISVFDKKEIANEIMDKINSYNYQVYVGEDYLSKIEGFDMIFRSPSLLPNTKELKKEVERGAKLTTEVEMVLELAPCKIIGVTGTEGKTTTTSIISSIIKQEGINCYLGGNIGTPLFTKLNEIKPEDIIVLELSSFQLMGMKVSPNISVITNLFPDHLDYHSSLEEYYQAKKSIFLNQKENEISIFNLDNEVTKKMATESKGKVKFFSSKSKVENGYIYDEKDGFIKHIFENNEENIINKKDIKLRGIHNYENICAALTATEGIVSKENQIKAIENFIGVEHRLEFVKEINGVKYYNDSIGTSPASTIAGLNSFDENIILIAGGSDKGLDYTEIGKKIAEKVGTLILTGPTANKIEEATKKALLNRNLDIIHCENLEEAVMQAKEKSKPGDVVLLSPASASFDAFKNFMERGNKFKEIVNKI